MTLAEKIKRFFSYFTWFEITYVTVGLIAIIVVSIIVKSSAITILYSIFGIIYCALLASKFKVSLLFAVLQVSFYIVQSVLYKNWGEVILNSAIVLPIILASIISWFTGADKKKEQVTKNQLKNYEWILLAVIFVVVAISFYFILDALDTQNAVIACISCAFTAAAHYLLLRKSQYMFHVFIGLNIVLFILWLLPIIQGDGFGIESLPMLITLVVYSISNIRGIVNWSKEKKASLASVTSESHEDTDNLEKDNENKG